jgi:hypothetical protein
MLDLKDMVLVRTRCIIQWRRRDLGYGVLYSGYAAYVGVE